VVFVVHDPDFVVDRVVDVEMGPVGLSLAETVTVLEPVQLRRLQLWRVIEVGSSATEKSAPIAIVPSEAHPNSSEMSVNLPLLANEYLKTSRHGGPSDPSSLDVTERFVSVHTSRLPEVEQLEAELKKDVPFGDVSAETGATRTTNRPIEVTRDNVLMRRMLDPLVRHAPVSRRSASTRVRVRDPSDRVS
jgi:hypothetical protein